MKYRVYVDETKKRKDGMMPVALIFEDGGKRFKVTTGLFSTQKFKGREFPDSEPNFRAKTVEEAEGYRRTSYCHRTGTDGTDQGFCEGGSWQGGDVRQDSD